MRFYEAVFGVRPDSPGGSEGLMGSAKAQGDPFDALGDSNRRAIIELLVSGGLSVHEIADAMPISRPAVSRHLRLLREAGLVTEEPAGRCRIYRLHDAGVKEVRAYLTGIWTDAANRFRRVAENTEAE
ncbi:MAG: metalloregulator ArsR/SmtB family transcription factor [Actinomycetota bacterium]